VDNPHNLRAIHRMLRDQVYEVIDATTGEAGLLAVHQHHPDLIRLDIKSTQH
jgi:CheY-like chemotaxis protein